MNEHDLKDYLSLGTMGENHLLSAAQKSFTLSGQAATPENAHSLIELGVGLLCLSWAGFPLNGPMAGEIVRLSGTVPAIRKMLKPEALSMATRIAQMGPENDDRRAQVCFVHGDYDKLDGVLEEAVVSMDPLNAIRQAYVYQGTLSRWDWLADFVTRTLSSEDPIIAKYFLAGIYLADSQFEKAAAAYAKLEIALGMPGLRFRLATALAGMGDRDKSLQVLDRVLDDFPMHTSALLLMDSLAFPADRTAKLAGKCVVSIYSYNKASELKQTLESVLASDLSSQVGNVTLRVLINGCEDDSLQVAEAAKDRFGGSMEVISLPVNVGAPAARNWLLDAARKDGADWIVYLDDDVLVPTDWLKGLAAGAAEFPEAGAWGCRVGDATSANITQHGDAYLLSKEDAQSQDRIIGVYAPSSECMIPLQLGYRRHCATVTGCCHMFKVDTLSENNGFDLIYSPSQYDDFDSDLRLLSSGKPVVYLGDVGITHLRVSPRIAHPSAGAAMQSDNHLAMLEARHGEQLESLLKVQSAYVKADLKMKRKRLQDAGFLPVSL